MAENAEDRLQQAIACAADKLCSDRLNKKQTEAATTDGKSRYFRQALSDPVSLTNSCKQRFPIIVINGSTAHSAIVLDKHLSLHTSIALRSRWVFTTILHLHLHIMFVIMLSRDFVVQSDSSHTILCGKSQQLGPPNAPRLFTSRA